MAARIAAVIAALALAGCGAADEVAGVGWDEPWRDRNGENVPEDVVVTYRGAEHCGWQSTVFLVVGWPLGTPAADATQGRMYVRNREPELRDYLRGRFDDDARLPRGARDTGYRLDGVELWVGPRDGSDTVYVVRGDRVERWPRAKSHIACA